MNQSILQVFCAFFSGLLQALSISNSVLPFGSPFIALFALVPMYYAFYKADTYRKGFWIFFVQTITVHIFSSSWLANFHGYAIFTLGASALGTGLLGGITGLVLHFFPAQIKKISRLEQDGGSHPFLMPGRILWFCASWVFWEWIKSTGILAYPWGTVSMAAYRWKIFTQIADITGVWGITFLFTLFSSVLAEGLWLLVRIRPSQNPSAMALSFKGCAKFMFAMFLISGVYGFFQYVIPRTPIKTMNTVIVQQNADPWEAGDRKSIMYSTELTEKALNELSEKGDKADLVLWSEGTLNRLFPDSVDFYSYFPDEESLSEFIERMKVPFIIGASALVDPYKLRYTNTSVLYDRKGTFSGFYSKMHLVPFAEQIPLADNPLMSWFMKNVVGMGSSMAPGKQTVLFNIPLVNNMAQPDEAPLEYNMPSFSLIELDKNGFADIDKAYRYIKNPERNPMATVTFSTPICFEDAFPDVCRKLFAAGSEVFLNITNDSWSKTAAAEYQHFIAASYLSIEFRTSLVRCCNSGYSAVVGPNGKILADMDIFERDAITFSVPIYERKTTVFAAFGDWFAYTVILCMALYFALEAYRFYLKGRLPKIHISITTENKKVEEQVEAAAETTVEPQIQIEAPKPILSATLLPKPVQVEEKPLPVVAEPKPLARKPRATKTTTAAKSTKVAKSTTAAKTTKAAKTTTAAKSTKAAKTTTAAKSTKAAKTTTAAKSTRAAKTTKTKK